MRLPASVQFADRFDLNIVLQYCAANISNPLEQMDIWTYGPMNPTNGIIQEIQRGISVSSSLHARKPPSSSLSSSLSR